jgi:hypothetical protein
MFAKSSCGESVFQLAQTLLFSLHNILHYAKPYMETIGYEISFLVFNQSGIIALQDSLLTYFSYNEPVWDVSKEKMWCVGGLEHPNISRGLL